MIVAEKKQASPREIFVFISLTSKYSDVEGSGGLCRRSVNKRSDRQ